MTTTAQVRQVVQPLLQRNPDLALVGRMIVIRPVHHFFRGVYVDRSLDPDAFVPTGTINILFKRRTDIGFSWGDRIYRTGGVWKINDPDLSVAMCEAIENQALPVLRPITTIEHSLGSLQRSGFRTNTWTYTILPRYLLTSLEAIWRQHARSANI